MSTEPQKCAHPPCSCLVSKDGAHGKYCSANCEQKKDAAEIRCGCGHPGCS